MPLIGCWKISRSREPPEAMRALCQHTLLEFHGCAPSRLKRAREVKALLNVAVRHGGGTIVKAVFHNFSPYGVSGVVVITESHVTIHTWPEHGYAAVDIFSCSKKLDHPAIQRRLKKSLSARRVSRRYFSRGLLPEKKRGRKR
jgi:S-adenosylmethionine decarboxylase proenzyme